jgi:predicted DNA-binding transcriptional regulator AlpA
MKPVDKYIPLHDVCQIAGGISPVTLWREERAGRFPKRRKITARRVGWLESEIREWIASHTLQGKGGGDA